MKDLLVGVNVVVKAIYTWKFYVVVWQAASKNSAKVRAKHIPPFVTLGLAFVFCFRLG